MKMCYQWVSRYGVANPFDASTPRGRLIVRTSSGSTQAVTNGAALSGRFVSI